MQEIVKQYCPFCGEPIELLIDCSIEHQIYIEDCQVCCRPMQITVEMGFNGEILISLCREND